MKEKMDLGVALLAAAAVLFGLNYLTQCSSASHRAALSPISSAASPRVGKTVEHEADEESDHHKSVAEQAAEEDNEERARVQNIGHALQTIGSNPEYRKTIGLPP